MGFKLSLVAGCFIVLKRSLSNDFLGGKIAFFVSIGRICFWLSFTLSAAKVVAVFGSCWGIIKCCREVRVGAISCGAYFEGSCTALRRGLLSLIGLAGGFKLWETGRRLAIFNWWKAMLWRAAPEATVCFYSTSTVFSSSRVSSLNCWLVKSYRKLVISWLRCPSEIGISLNYVSMREQRTFESSCMRDIRLRMLSNWSGFLVCMYWMAWGLLFCLIWLWRQVSLTSSSLLDMLSLFNSTRNCVLNIWPETF